MFGFLHHHALFGARGGNLRGLKVEEYSLELLKVSCGVIDIFLDVAE